MTGPSPRALELRTQATGLEWWLGHCGRCAACTAGHEAWCTDYIGPESTERRHDGSWRRVTPALLAALEPDACAATAVVLDVLDGAAEPDPCVLVVGLPNHADALGDVLTAMGTTVVVEPTLQPERLSARTREELGTLSSSGRPDVVVSFGGSLRGCTRWVRRGGTVAACPWWLDDTGAPVELDTMTMREVTVAPLRRPHAQLLGGR